MGHLKPAVCVSLETEVNLKRKSQLAVRGWAGGGSWPGGGLRSWAWLGVGRGWPQTGSAILP